MPELPEVETTARDLRLQLLGAEISGVHVVWHRTLTSLTPAELAAALLGQRIVNIGRRGKFVLLGLDGGACLLVHLRMTGRLRVEPADSRALAGPHVRAWLDLADGRHLTLTDQRKFGRIWLVRDTEEVLGKLGPEPLEPGYSPEVLAAGLSGRRAAIKTLLLDQRLVAGLGNIYANEALFVAGIHPARPGGSLSPEEICGLHAAIRQVLAEAVAARGTTLRDYRPPLGERGEYQGLLRVHGRAGLPCSTCGTPIATLRQAQRACYYCPHCQT